MILGHEFLERRPSEDLRSSLPLSALPVLARKGFSWTLLEPFSPEEMRSNRSWPLLWWSCLLLGRSWVVLGRSWAVLSRSWVVLGRSWSPLTPPAASEQPGRIASYFYFSLLKLPKPLLTSLHFSSLFLSRLGSLLGSILAPSWAPFWPKFGPKLPLDTLPF